MYFLPFEVILKARYHILVLVASMFSKILVANRGEIACRIIQTINKMGIESMAVFSDADANSKHIALADTAVNIGPSKVDQSYLRGDIIIQAALREGADAIHPGYGFLSENSDFVKAVEICFCY